MKKLYSWWIARQLYIQIIICTVIGILYGLLFAEDVQLIKPVGDIFLRMLKMLIIPLTFFTLVSGITKMKELRFLKSVGGMTILFYMLTSLFASALGITVGLISNPGKGVRDFIDVGEKVPVAQFNFIDNLVNWFPTNPLEAMVSGNMLQVIIFSFFVGIALLALGEKVSRLTVLFSEASELMLKITDFVMKFSPYGILSLVANMTGSLKSELLTEVVKFIVSDYLALLLILIFVYPLLIKYIAKCKPLIFYRNITPAMVVAASTTSSAATLPVSLTVAEENMGIPQKIFAFTLPLGATINMDGMAAYLGLVSVFAGNMFDIPINAVFILQFLLLGLVLSIGTAGVKGGGIIMSTILFQTLNMPLTLIPILAAIWPILDIVHTTTNVTGDLTVTTIVTSRLKALNQTVFESKKEVKD